MSLFYVLGPCIFHIPVGAVYVAVKVVKAVLVGGVLMLQSLVLAVYEAHGLPGLKGYLHELSAS